MTDSELEHRLTNLEAGQKATTKAVEALPAAFRQLVVDLYGPVKKMVEDHDDTITEIIPELVSDVKFMKHGIGWALAGVATVCATAIPDVISWGVKRLTR